MFSAAEVPPALSDPEADLLDACRQGDLNGFERLYKAHSGRMKSIAFHILADCGEAENVLQEAFLKIYRAVPAFEGDSGFLAWMYRILLNCCYDAARKRQLHAESGLESEPSIPTRVPLQVASSHALNRIHSGCRTVFWKRELKRLLTGGRS